MEDKKVINKLLKRFIMVVILAIFTTFYIAVRVGYYKNIGRSKAIFTQEQIYKFESDVKEGKNVDLEDYLVNMYPYEDGKPSFGAKVSETIDDVTKKVIEKTFKILGNFVET